jgi:hypothetical protein
MPHEFPVITCKAKETTQLFCSTRRDPVLKRENLVIFRGYPLSTNHVTQVRKLLLCEGAFGALNMPVITTQKLQYLLQIR